MAPVFALLYPWGLLDVDGAGGMPARAVLEPGRPARLPAGCTPLLALPEGGHAAVQGHRLALHPEGGAFAWDTVLYRLHALPVVDELRIEHRRDGAARMLHLAFDGQVARPTTRVSEAEDGPAERLDSFVQGILSRLLALADDDEAEPRGDARALPGVRLGWERLALLWLDPEGDRRQPSMDLIVRHAEDLRHLVVELAEHPRRVLTRVREMQAVSRIQQQDAACLGWYIRQPGRTAVEKAGGRQRLLGVARQESVDTVENRVLKDLTLRSAEAAALYARANAGCRDTLRWQTVRRYGSVCQRLGRELEQRGIADPVPPAKPNYVLLHDSRYRRVWAAYQELLRRRDVQDEAWRWQRRLWADVARMVVQVALLWAPGIERVALAPLILRREQDCGRWTENDLQWGLFLMRREHRGIVVAPLDATQGRPHRGLADWHHALGPSLVLHAEDCRDGRQGTLFVWALHGTADGDLALEAAARSADAALTEAARTRKRTHGDEPRVAGLILRSAPDPTAPAECRTIGKVTALTVGAQPNAMQAGVECCGTQLSDALWRMLA